MVLSQISAVTSTVRTRTQSFTLLKRMHFDLRCWADRVDPVSDPKGLLLPALFTVARGGFFTFQSFYLVGFFFLR